MSVSSETICRCPLGEIMNVISRKWAILIINVIGNEKRVRYRDIKKALDGINSKTLSDRLKDLVEFNLIEREMFPEIPPRVEYSLTRPGMELRAALLPLLDWVYNYENGLERSSPCDQACMTENK